MSSEGAQSIELSKAPTVEVKIRKSFRDLAFYFLKGNVKLVQVGMIGESKIGCLRDLIILSSAFSVKLKKLEIPCHWADEALFYSLCHSL